MGDLCKASFDSMSSNEGSLVFCEWAFCTASFESTQRLKQHLKKHAHLARPVKRVPDSSQDGSSLLHSFYQPAQVSADPRRRAPSQQVVLSADNSNSTGETTEQSESQHSAHAQAQGQGHRLYPHMVAQDTSTSSRPYSYDELPAPQMTAPPATIPQASQQSQYSQAMSIQETQEAPSPESFRQYSAPWSSHHQPVERQAYAPTYTGQTHSRLGVPPPRSYIPFGEPTASNPQEQFHFGFSQVPGILEGSYDSGNGANTVQPGQSGSSGSPEAKHRQNPHYART